MRGPIDEGGVAFEDLTARARIREAALMHFAEEGYERATVRAIARSAGVSPGLLRHHYGSKEELRTACDDYVFESLHRLNEQLLEDPGRRRRHPARLEAVRALRGSLPGRRVRLGRADLRRDGVDDGAMADPC